MLEILKDKKVVSLIVSVPFLAIWLTMIWQAFTVAILIAAIVGAWRIGALIFNLADWLTEKYYK
jgi:hypothetical protein